MKELRFPKHFFWGAGTSAHQTEGNNTYSDWFKAEKDGLIKEQSGGAADHYRLFEQDFEAAEILGHNAHRFSIEWSRIEPEPGQFSEEATIHYRQKILSLREKGIEPIVSLHHFTSPAWFTEAGGWQKASSRDLFSRYVQYCADHFGDYVKWWVTINEPTALATAGYLQGVWPPFKRSGFACLNALLNLAAAHRQAYIILHKKHQNVHVGIAHNVASYVPARKNSSMDKFGAKLVKFLANDYLIRLLRGKYDYIGLNYYSHHRVYFRGTPAIVAPTGSLQTDTGEAIAPQGLLQVLRELHKYRIPILITENGIADRSDKIRFPYIVNHLLMVYAAITEGIDIRGYLYSSLIDGFEWSEGFEPRLGLIEVDFESKKRTVRDSAWKYSKIAKRNAIQADLLEMVVGGNEAAYPEVLRRYLQKISKIKPKL